MARHELDLLSLLSGLFFTLVAFGFLLDAATDVWVVPLVLISVGVVGLAASFAAARRQPAPEPAPAGPGPDPDPEPVRDR
jgi:uncharacterized membrane protein